MHILVTSDTLGGVWTYTRELVTGLHARGHRLTLVSFGNIPSPQEADWITSLGGVDFRPTAFRLEWMQEAGFQRMRVEPLVAGQSMVVGYK